MVEAIIKKGIRTDCIGQRAVQLLAIVQIYVFLAVLEFTYVLDELYISILNRLVKGDSSAKDIVKGFIITLYQRLVETCFVCPEREYHR